MCTAPVSGAGVYPGWCRLGGQGRGNTGTPSHLLEEVHLTAKRAPEGLQGLEWVVRWTGRPGCTGTTTPCGRARSAVPVHPSPSSRPYTRLLANKGEIKVNILRC